MTRYRGAEPATGERVLRYLRENYLMPDESNIGDVDGLMLVRDHQDELEKAMHVFGSHAYYVGDKVAEAEGLVEKPGGDDEDEDEEPDW